MSQKTVQDFTIQSPKTQTPFDRFKEALAVVASVPKSSLPKTKKKPAQKK